MWKKVILVLALSLTILVSKAQKGSKNSINSSNKLSDANRQLEEEIRKASANTDNSQATTGVGKWLADIRPDIGQANYDQLREVAYYVRTLPLSLVTKISPGNAGNPENVKRVESILSASKWKEFFPYTSEDTKEGTPEGIGIYSYENFLKAVGAFPAFCGDYKLHPTLKNVNADLVCKKLLATSFAHYNKETSANARNWKTPIDKQGLYWVREVGCKNGQCGGYTMGKELYPESLTRGNTYFGRGAKQLSHPANYGTFSLLLFGSADVLLKTPDLVADTWLALGSAIYFTCTPVSSKPAIIEVIDGNFKPNQDDLSKNFVPGFGLTTHIVNGGIECMGWSPPKDPANGKTFSEIRGDYFKYYCKELGVTEPINAATLTCEKMKSLFSLSSSSSRPYYLAPGECNLVKWESTFIAYGGKESFKKCRGK